MFRECYRKHRLEFAKRKRKENSIRRGIAKILDDKLPRNDGELDRHYADRLRLHQRYKFDLEILMEEDMRPDRGADELFVTSPLVRVPLFSYGSFVDVYNKEVLGR